MIDLEMKTCWDDTVIIALWKYKTLPLLQIQTLTDDTGQKDRLKEDNCRKDRNISWLHSINGKKLCKQTPTSLNVDVIRDIPGAFFSATLETIGHDDVQR